jgi:hypothetical protein
MVAETEFDLFPSYNESLQLQTVTRETGSRSFGFDHHGCVRVNEACRAFEPNALARVFW